mgnify:CR=1 FL=1
MDSFRAALKDPTHALLNPGFKYKFLEEEEDEDPVNLVFYFHVTDHTFLCYS